MMDADKDHIDNLLPDYIQQDHFYKEIIWQEE